MAIILDTTVLLQMLEAWDAEVTVEEPPLAALDTLRCDALAAMAQGSGFFWGRMV